MSFSGNKIYGVLKAFIKIDEGEFTSKKSGMSHYNFISAVPNEDSKEYQVNIDIQSQVASNVRMLSKKNFDVASHLPASFIDIKQGFTKLETQPGGLAIDLIHQPLFSVDELKNADLQSAEQISDILNGYLSAGTEVLVFGTMYDDSDNKYHEAYRNDNESYRDHHMYGARRHREQQMPPRGVDDVHLNQGTPSSQYQSKDNGTYQDGALFVVNQDGRYDAIFFAFAGQCFDTNEKGNCVNDESNQTVK
ncbi:DUF2278 family protein [Photobacterium minamisatsumaniensis]|uniref:DUF2278 family protein n=1 Tax=Photobacterium minamisatsumaniensis TaxID=2910233 RepID=UPI003D13651F